MRFVLVLLLFIASPVFAEQPPPHQSFQDWLADFKFDAMTQGISADVLEEVFSYVDEPSADIIALDRKQPESTRTFSEYIEGVVTAKKIADAKERWRTHKKLLRKIEAKYHVPAPVLLALWGLESNFGRNQGDLYVVQSLATLAYDGRRSEFFRAELMDALKIIENEELQYQDLTGSWAGAMGQCQFMPSSFLKFAVDFDHDGKKDIWESDADVLASIANYLHSKGWQHKTGWGLEVEVPEDTDISQWHGEKNSKPLKEWRKLGFLQANGRPLPRRNIDAKLVIPDDNSSAYLVFSNYNVIMDWNRSIYFATSVGLLADAIGHK